LAKFRFVQWLWDWLFALDEFSFEWDRGNVIKSFQKHGVTCREAEEMFTGPVRCYSENSMSLEPRFAALGETSEGKLLFLAFTLRSENIRVISARPMNERERKFYASLRQE
jgi:uncharacterized DUF497 family protein